LKENPLFPAITSLYIAFTIIHMAKQCGILQLTGTIGNLTFYEMEGNYYVKTKTEVSSKKIKNDPRYANTMRHAKTFGHITTLAKKVYYQLNVNERDYKTIWIPLRKRTNDLVRQFLPDEDILRILESEFLPLKKQEQQIIEAPPIITRAVETLFLQSDYDTNATKLIDHLVASRLFIKNLLEKKLNLREIYGVKYKASKKDGVTDS
jgi:hypothetical protein